MKDESVSKLLESGELVRTDDVVFMIEQIMKMFQRGMDSDSGGQFIGFAINLLSAWHEVLSSNGVGGTDLADEVIANIVMGTGK